jgi:hypothetical protein
MKKLFVHLLVISVFEELACMLDQQAIRRETKEKIHT